ncbi:Oidioi.mRNA.OKI2018_I69.XSR.g15603.t1.cds [Oikopleura dioica]|uniref:Oidioi.mRNA.OKI2018_I69.XSR.g15603.t1.cds n=1 Tax=Oikopleura dioica TaxID=34765 RepID=A0ABN7SDC5_OIKDI|nr:Oidioi.mRNA.OKI2018_I69.XSR.g15603.t1.cds [Oikopleura dioica]
MPGSEEFTLILWINFTFCYCIQVAHGSSVETVHSVDPVERLGQVANMANMKASFSNRVRLFDNFEEYVVGKTFNGAKFSKVIEWNSVKLKTEARSLATIFPIGDVAAKIIHQFSETQLKLENLRARNIDFDCHIRISDFLLGDNIVM